MIIMENKVVIITGGANGIGAAIVKYCGGNGVKCITFLDVDEKAGHKLQNELQEQYSKSIFKFIKCDVTKDEQLYEAYDTVLRENGYIDLVVNNAGIANEHMRTYKKLIEINYTAVVTSTLKGLEIMRKDKGGRGGTIINVSSVAALIQMTNYCIYSGSKSAVLQFSNCVGLQDYYSKTGVRVMAVCFGLTDTDILGNLISFDPSMDESARHVLKNFPLQAVESAARGLMDVYEKGNSGDTWLVTSNKPALDITPKVKKAYEIFSEDLFS